MISPFGYNSYRKFIKDYVAFKKKYNKTFSLRLLCAKAGITTTSFFSQVIKGNRNLSKKTVIKTIKAFGLTSSEALYFENLVFYNQSKNKEEKTYYRENLDELSRINNIKSITMDELEYFSVWYNPVLRELLPRLRPPYDFKEIGNTLQPKITSSQVRESISLLLKTGLLFQNEDKTFSQRDPLIKSTSDRDSLKTYLINAQIELMSIIKSSYLNTLNEDRMSATSIYAISPKYFEKSVKLIRELRRKLLSFSDKKDEENSRVYVYMTNLIPVTKEL